MFPFNLTLGLKLGRKSSLVAKSQINGTTPGGKQGEAERVLVWYISSAEDVCLSVTQVHSHFIW